MLSLDDPRYPPGLFVKPSAAGADPTASDRSPLCPQGELAPDG
jgi:hypothetical protein